MIYYYIYRGIKYGSVNFYKIRCMGKRIAGHQCKYGAMTPSEFLMGCNSVELGSEWID